MSHDFIPAFNGGEQEDSEIQDILTSFYFTEREVKEDGSENPYNREPLRSESTDGCGEQEDVDLYDLYGEGDDEDSSQEDSECSDADSEASSQSYSRNASAPHISRRPTHARQAQEDKRIENALARSKRSGAVKSDLLEERRGRSTAVPTKLMRWADDAMKHNLIDTEDNRDKLQQNSRKGPPSQNVEIQR